MFDLYKWQDAFFEVFTKPAGLIGYLIGVGYASGNTHTPVWKVVCLMLLGIPVMTVLNFIALSIVWYFRRYGYMGWLYSW